MSLVPPRVWVVEDDAELRAGLTRLLRSVGLKTEASASALEFLTLADIDEVECVLTDVRMPGMTGIELVERLAPRAPRPQVIVMTMHGDAPSAVRAMKAGAFDYIEKPLRELELIELVHKAISSARQQRVRQEHRRLARAALGALSPREREVMEQVVIGRMNKEIARLLNISVRTVELHRAKVMDKTGCATLTELVTLALTAAGSDAPTTTT